MLFDMENGLIPVLSHIFTRCGVTPNMYYDEVSSILFRQSAVTVVLYLFL